MQVFRLFLTLNRVVFFPLLALLSFSLAPSGFFSYLSRGLGAPGRGGGGCSVPGAPGSPQRAEWGWPWRAGNGECLFLFLPITCCAGLRRAGKG